MIERKSLDDRTLLAIEPENLQPGATVVIESQFRTAATIPQDVFYVQQGYPVVRYEVEADTRGGWSIEPRMSGLTPTETGKDDVIRFVFENIPARQAAKSDYAPTPPRGIFALNYVAPGEASPFSTWNDVARWALDMFGMPGSRDLAEPGTTALPNVESAGEAARAFRYFAISLGTGAFVPRQPEVTAERRFGDCKDKALHMVDALEQQGLAAYPVLIVAPSDRFVPADLPGPFFFNHAIVAIPWEKHEVAADMTVVDHPELGRLRLFDATMSRHSATDTSVWYEGAAALVLHPGVQSLVYLPESDGSENRLERRHVWQLRESDAVNAVTETAAYGVFRGRLQSEYGTLLEGEPLREITRSRLSRLGLRTRSLEVRPVAPADDGAWSFRSSYRLPLALGQFEEVRALSIGRLRSVDTLPVPGDDDAPYLAFIGTWADRIEIDHVGVDYIGEPVGIDVENALGRVRAKTFEAEGVLTIQRELVLRSREPEVVTDANLEELRTALNEVNELVLPFE